MVRRAWGLTDQVVSSATSFLLFFVAARNLSASGFGKFATAVTVYFLTQALVRGISSDVVLATEPQALSKSSRGPLRQAQGICLIAGGAAGAVIMAVGLGLAAHGWGWSLVIVGVATPVILLQDTRRMLLIHLGMTRRAATSTLSLGFSLLTALLALRLLGWLTPSTLVACWGASAGFAILVTRGLPAPLLAFAWLTSRRREARFLIAEATSQSAAGQAGLLLVAASLGPTAIGSIRAATLLLAPVSVLGQAGAILFVSEGRRLPLSRLSTMVTQAQLSFLAVGLVMTSFWLVAPRPLAEALVGESAGSAMTVIAPIGIFVTMATAMVPPSLALRVIQEFRTAAAWRAVLMPVLVVFPVLGASWSGLSGAAAGLALSTTVTASVWTAVFILKFRGRQS